MLTKDINLHEPGMYKALQYAILIVPRILKTQFYIGTSACLKNLLRT